MDMVDVAFSLRGDTIPADHGWQLYRLLAAHLDWLATEPEAAVHPIRGSRAVAGVIHLGPRARLMLRLPRTRAEQAFALSGARFDLGNGVEVGDARLRPLFPHGTLYSQFITTGSPDETGFHQDVTMELQGAGIGCKVVCGRIRRMQAQDTEIVGYSLMLHELSPDDSLRMQATGLGKERKFGCGIFIPHKSAAAVGT